MNSFCIRRRWIMALFAHCGFLCVYAVRVNLSIVIVAMVNITQVHKFASNYTECQADGALDTERPTGGELNWNQVEQGYALSSFFYGYMLTQIPGGVLANLFGGKRIFAVGLLGASVMVLLAPLAARLGLYVLVVNRFIDGLFEGLTLPSMFFVLAQWSPQQERSRLVSFASSGYQVGAVLTLPMSAFISDSFGWPTAFYFFGSVGVLFVVIWLFFAYESPQLDPHISHEEKLYIMKSFTEAETIPVPWKSVLTSPPVLSATFAYFCNNWTYFLVLTGLPSYFQQVLGFSMNKNGLMSTLPFIAASIGSAGSGFIADFILKRNVPITRARKAMTWTAFLGTSTFLVTASYARCGQTAFPVLCLVLAVGFLELNTAGFFTSLIDISPKFSGVLTGMATSIATLSGCTTPIVTGLFINNKPNREQYQKVFLLAAGLAVLGAIVFSLFGSGEVQAWNDVQPKNTLNPVHSEDHEISEKSPLLKKQEDQAHSV